MNEYQRYLIEEFAEEYQARRMSRRDLIRRAVLIMGSVPAGLTALAAVGCGGDDAEDAATATSSATSPAPSSTATASATSPSAASATASAATTTKTEAVTFKGPASDLLGYLAQPSADGEYLGILVIHENRGLNDHIRDVARRYAAEGFVALAVDLVSRGGGSTADTAANTGALGRAKPEEFVADLQAYADYLASLPRVRRGGIGVTGFCFGGGYTWEAAAAVPSVKAAVPFYGLVHNEVMDKLATTPAAVLVVYAANDTRITSQQETVRGKLEASGRPFEIKVYPNTGHAFFNDTGGAYNAEAAKDAFGLTVAWFRKHVPG